MNNPVLAQLPRAQEAYMSFVEATKEIDTTELLLAANAAIRQGMASRKMATTLRGILDIVAAEKVATELSRIGYNVSVVGDGVQQGSDGVLRQQAMLMINWRWMPANSRDEYSL